MNTRQCPFDGCKKMIDPERFACGPHWFSLNKEQKATIWRIYGQWQRAEITGEDLRVAQERVLDEAQGR